MSNRTTFNESWYRVADLRPRLRSTLQTHRQQFRGQTWHVAQDPSSNQFFRLDDAGYHFVALLDGKRTVTEAWAICNEQFGDAAPTQSEAIHLLGQLYTANLLQADLPSDAAGLFERDRDRTRREIGGFFMNLLFARIPLFDPDMLLGRWERVLGPLLFRVPGFLAWSTLLAVAAYYLIGRADALVAGASSIIAPANMLLLYVSLAGVKAVHEFGHGLASKHVGRVTGRGGAVHGFGITLLVFTPLPYVDASSSWAFRSKWHRALVGVAGMYVELAVAAIAAIVWANTSPGLVNALAYNIIFVAGVSTIVFNANPLFRFDGYYVLSDLLEIPNLSSRARDHLIYLVKRYVFGLKQAASSVIADGEQWWLPLYGIAAALYRVIVSVGIVLFVADKFLLVGLLLAVSAVFSWLVMPFGRVLRYLATASELARVRHRALVTSGLFVAFVIVAVGVVPVPQRAQAEGVLEPFELTVVRAEADGFVDAVLASGATVDPEHDLLVTARNDDLELALVRLLAEQQLTHIQRSAARVEETALAQSLDERLLSLRQQIERTEQRLDALAIPAPARGHWVAPDVERLLGAYVERGAKIGYIASLDALLVRAVANQRLGPRLESEIGIDAEVRVCVRGQPDLEFTGTIQELLPAGFRELPSAALGYAAGGAMAVELEDESGLRSVDPFFEIHVSVPDDAVAAHRLCGGQRVVVRFELPDRPLAMIGWRALRQLIQRRFEI